MKIIKDWLSADKHNEVIVLGGCIALVLAVYSTAISSYFVVGELRQINYSIPETWKDVLQFFISRGWESVYYRPIVKLTLWMNYSLFNLNPVGHHVFNLCFHIFNTVLVFHFADLLTKDKNISTIAALAFAAHPLHTDAVIRILNNNSLTSTFFYMLAVISFIKYLSFTKRRSAYFAITILTFILSLLTRESAISLPAVLFLYEFIHYRRKQRSHELALTKEGSNKLIPPWLSKYIPFLLVLLLFFAFRAFILGPAMPGRHIGLETPLRVSYHFLQLFAPINIHTFNFHDFSQLLLNIMILCTFLPIMLVLALHTHFQISRNILAYCSLWVLITSFPLYLMSLAFMSQARLLYISSVGSSILLATCIMKGYYHFKKHTRMWSKIALIFVLFCLLSSWSLRAIQRNRIYPQVGAIAQNILFQFKNMYPEFPKGSSLYLIKFPSYFLTDGETPLRPISDYSGALQLQYHDRSLNIYQDWHCLDEPKARPITSPRGAVQPEYRPKSLFTRQPKLDEALHFLKSHSFFENLKRNERCFVFEYQNGVVVETTSLYMKEIGPGRGDAT